MVRRTQFLVHAGREDLACRMFASALEKMPIEKSPLHVTVERTNQYQALRSKLAKRATKGRRSAETQLAQMRRDIKHLIASYRGDEPVQWLRQILKGTYSDG